MSLMNLQAAIALHVPASFIEDSREDGTALAFRQVGGTVRVTEGKDDPDFYYLGSRISQLSAKNWAVGLKYYFESLTDAKRFIDQRRAARAEAKAA